MTLRARIAACLDSAVSDGDDVKIATLRLLTCAVRDRDRGAHARDLSGCPDAEVLALLNTMIRQREASIRDYEDAGRVDLAEQERLELEALKCVMPPPLPDEEVRSAAERVVADLDASGLKDIGRCVTELKSRFPGRVDAAAAGAAVKNLLAAS